jgi:hypothetical protein
MFSLFALNACISDKPKNSENEKQAVNKAHELEKVEVTDNTDPLKSATKANLLKDMLIAKLKNNTEKQDVLLTSFLSNYANLISKENIDVNKMSLKEVEDLGYSITTSEGDKYLAKNTAFIKDGIMEYLNPLSLKFINLYCEDIDKVCCEDAGFSISRKTLVQRVLDWGQLADEAKSTAFSEIAESSYSSYLYLLFNGLDNTPAFDFQTNKFNQEALTAMEEVELNYSDTRAGQAFIEYIDVLFGEEFIKTEYVQEYLDELFK